MFADVMLDCAGTVDRLDGHRRDRTRSSTRASISSTGNFQSVNGCNNGSPRRDAARAVRPDRMGMGHGRATTGFFTQAVSYAYPAGASVKPINTIIIQ